MVRLALCVRVREGGELEALWVHSHLELARSDELSRSSATPRSATSKERKRRYLRLKRRRGTSVYAL
jgi:hypothetical protein